MTKEEILGLAQHAKHYNELLIKHCQSWLPEEEGIRNVEQRIRERRKRKGTVTRALMSLRCNG